MIHKKGRVTRGQPSTFIPFHVITHAIMLICRQNQQEEKEEEEEDILPQ
jgi:uncharacterized membrane protein